MSRSVIRLDSLYDTFKEVHKKAFPDWRFGQLISNFMSWCVSNKKCGDIFFPEDDKWELWIKEYANDLLPYKPFDTNTTCECYRTEYGKTVCYGTKEMEECDCGGDRNKCNFY